MLSLIRALFLMLEGHEQVALDNDAQFSGDDYTTRYFRKDPL
jgi:hypothetical protein